MEFCTCRRCRLVVDPLHPSPDPRFYLKPPQGCSDLTFRAAGYQSQGHCKGLFVTIRTNILLKSPLHLEAKFDLLSRDVPGTYSILVTEEEGEEGGAVVTRVDPSEFQVRHWIQRPLQTASSHQARIGHSGELAVS